MQITNNRSSQTLTNNIINHEVLSLKNNNTLQITNNEHGILQSKEGVTIKETLQITNNEHGILQSKEGITIKETLQKET